MDRIALEAAAELAVCVVLRISQSHPALMRSSSVRAERVDIRIYLRHQRPMAAHQVSMDSPRSAEEMAQTSTTILLVPVVAAAARVTRADQLPEQERQDKEIVAEEKALTRVADRASSRDQVAEAPVLLESRERLLLVELVAMACRKTSPE